MNIRLPICKSFANRALLRMAVRGEDVSCLSLPADCPDDVRLLRDALCSTASTINCHNCGTAFRFLTAFFATHEGYDIHLTGDERMLQRPIRQLVSALQLLGANIAYEGQEGYPPLHIRGHKLHGGEVCISGAESSQFVSALLLVSEATEIGIQVQTDDSSPYIEMTKQVIQYATLDMQHCLDWSSAAFWYAYIALYGGSLCFDNLRVTGLQGDEYVAQIFAQLGVITEATDTGICISRARRNTMSSVTVDFQSCPDLYPAVYMTCQRLGVSLRATGTERLIYKESDRLHAFEQLQEARAVYASYHDHRVAMALLIAGYQVDETDCISKSYPQFIEQYEQTFLNYILVVPCRNITRLPLFCKPPYARIIFVDDHSTDGTFAFLREHFPTSVVLRSTEPQGKKGALFTGIQEARRRGANYVWLTDYDTLLPQTPAFGDASKANADMYILPLKMKAKESLLARLQQVEYIGIQAITLDTAERGKAIMASGANLLVRTSTWLECYTELHLNEPSGDDMYLLEAVKRKGLQVATMRSPIAEIEPIETYRAFFRQRCRWAGKAPHYTDKDILRYGTIVFILNVLAVLCPPIWLVKFGFEWHYVRGQKWWLAVLLSVIYPYYMLACLIGGLCLSAKRHW